MLVTEALTWEAARDRCLDMDGHLAVIESAEENDLIQQVTLSKFFFGIFAKSEPTAPRILNVLIGKIAPKHTDNT